MKMPDSVYQDLKQKMAALGSKDQILLALENYKLAGLTLSRFVWDMFWATKIPPQSLYRHGLNDMNIETGLRKALNEIEMGK